MTDCSAVMYRYGAGEVVWWWGVSSVV